MTKHPAMLGFVAYSGTGKTTLLEQLIPKLTSHNIRIGLIKHAHHNFDIDIPGKDSYRLRKAGAQQVLVASNTRQARIIENPMPNKEPSLKESLAGLQTSTLDLILVEGFKHEDYPKVEINRSDHPQPLIYPNDKNIIAFVSDVEQDLPEEITSLSLGNLDEITDFVRQYVKNSITG